MSELKVLIKTRGTIKSQLTRLATFLNSIDSFDRDDLELRQLKLEDINRNFCKIQTEIEIKDELEENIDLHESERANFEEQYYHCAKIIKRNLRSFTESRTVESVNSSNSKQLVDFLPKMDIKPFDGNAIDWHSFHDSFKTVIHDNNHLPAVQKFYYLKNYLVGNATSIIDSLNASEENYFVAWEALIQRYDRPRLIINAHLDLLLDLPSIQKDASSSLRVLSEKAQMHVNALKALGLATEHWDAILINIICKKIDLGTRKAWERSLESSQLPTVA